MRAYARVPLLAALAGTVVAALSGGPPAAPGTSPSGASPTGVSPTGAAGAAPPGASPSGAVGAAPGRPRAEGFRSSRTYRAVAAPARIRIPSLGVDSRLSRLGVRPDGSVAAPSDVAVAGWFSGGPRPGQDGPAVILGHVDSADGPGVFFDLAAARAGAPVRIDRADGTTVRFRITRVARVPKARFPTDLVYAPSLDPTLRLVTCGGSFDHARGSYRDNVIAFADLA